MNAEQYLEAVSTARDLPDESYLRAIVNITCLVNRRWLRDRYPDYPISYRDYQAIALPYQSFADDPELLAQLRLPDSVLLIEAQGRLLVVKVPLD